MDKGRNEHSGEKSGKMRSFAGMHARERENSLEFEFCRNNSLCLKSDPNHSFPAELLFNNGQLVPHAFPFHTVSRKTSCTSSMNSSRSPSSSYGSSSSSSQVSRQESLKKWPESETITGKIVHAKSPAVKKPAVVQQYSSLPRLQFLMPAPTRNYAGKTESSKKKAEVSSLTESGISGEMKVEGNRKPAGSWFGRGFFRSFVSACRECHALEPVVREDGLPGRITLG